MVEIKVLGRGCWGQAYRVEEAWMVPVGVHPETSGTVRGMRLVKSARDKWAQMRGGSWHDNVDLANSADDDLDFPEFHTSDVGLRLRRGGEHG